MNTTPPPNGRAVGIIGAGAMGMAMARNLLARGYQVHTRDVRAEADAEARGHGLRVCDSARALTEQVDCVLVVVVDAAQIDEVLFGADGVTQAPDGARCVLLCSTIAPDDASRFAARLAAHGIVALDAPISGGPARALEGTLSMMIAGPADTLHHWQGLLQDLAQRRFVLGERHGDAARAKLINNLLAGTQLVAAAEALALAQHAGLDAQQMLEIVHASSGQSWVFDDRMPRALAGRFDPPLAAARILTKDVGLATAMAAALGQPTPLGDAALARWRETVARGWGDLDDAAVIKTYQ